MLRYGGEWCSLTRWQASGDTSGSGAAKAEFVTKVFDSAEHAHEYFTRFWGFHVRAPLHYSFMADLSLSAPDVGKD